MMLLAMTLPLEIAPAAPLVKDSQELIKSSLHLIDNWLDYQVYIDEIPGLAVGIALEDELIFKKEYGYANLKKKSRLTDQHLFRIASQSKIFTATAIMMLYHEGKLSIDDKVSKHLPWFQSAKDKQLEHIRIHHLLTHSSGITRDGNTGHWFTHKFPTLKEIKAQFQEKIAFLEPSEIHKYSNFGYTLLGQIIENVSGQSYADFIQKRILSPLGMQNTVVDVDETNLARHATGYKPKIPKQERKPFDHIPANIMSPATGLSSTVEDLIKFYQAHLFGNDSLLPDYIKREMQRPHVSRGDFGTVSTKARGLGFAIEKIGNYTLVGHSGGYNGFVTDSVLIQDQKIVIVVLCNPGSASALLRKIVKIFNKLEKNRKEFLVEDQENRPDFSSIIGFYADADEWQILLYSQIGSKLVSIEPGLDNPMDFFGIFKHEQDYRFVETKENYTYYPGESFEFVDSPEGEKVLIESHKGKMFPYKFKY